MRTRERVTALLFAAAASTAAACGAGEPAREPARVPGPTVAVPRPPRSTNDGGAPEPLAPRKRERLTRFPTPAFGAGDVAPSAAHRFRLAVSTKAMRASASAAKIARSLSLLPAIVDAKQRVGVDPFEDGDWIVVYGPDVGAFITNANVIRHHETDDAVTQAIGRSALERSDRVEPGDGEAYASDLFGVDSVLLRPRPQTLAFVPQDRARDLLVALAKVGDPGLGSREIAKVALVDPSPRFPRFVPPEIASGEAVVEPASDGGLDVAAEGRCVNAEACREAAKTIEATVARSNTLFVRIATRGLLNGLAVRAEGARVKAKMHVEPAQIDAIVQLLRATFGLPSVDPVAPP